MGACVDLATLLITALGGLLLALLLIGAIVGRGFLKEWRPNFGFERRGADEGGDDVPDKPVQSDNNLLVIIVLVSFVLLVALFVGNQLPALFG